MHAQYVRTWFVGGLVALVLALPMAFAKLPVHATLLVLGVCYLSLAVSLGLLPAFVRRDWPSPLYAMAALLLGALTLPLATDARAFTALAGASLLVGAAQPLTLFFSPRWRHVAAVDAYRFTDRIALAGVMLSLAATAAGGLLLIALPRGLPNAAFATLLVGAALPAAFGALLFTLPRQAGKPLPLAILGGAGLAFLALSAAGLAAALAFPFAVEARGPVAGIALGLGFAVLTLLRAPRRPPLAASALALTVLAALALLLATLYGQPNALLPLAFYAFLALALALLASALVSAAPLLLPGRASGDRWSRWGPALLIASLFLYTPALQYGRSFAPAIGVGALGIVIVVAGLSRLARAAPAT